MPELKRSKRKCCHFYPPYSFTDSIYPNLPGGESEQEIEREKCVQCSSSSHHHYFHFSEKNIVKYLNLVEAGVRIDFVAYSYPLDGLEISCVRR